MPGNQDISSRLISAVNTGNLKTVMGLINNVGLSYSKAWSEGYVLLRDAAKRNHTAIVELLLTHGSKVNSKSSDANSRYYKPSDTPLHFATLNGNIEIVKMLLNKGANIDAKNQHGRTPLFNVIDSVNYGCNQDKLEVIELLLKHGADVNARDNNGTSLLHVAIVEKSLNIVKLLLEYGAYVNHTTYAETTAVISLRQSVPEGYAPLHCAVERDLKEITTLLLSKGANVDAEGKDGITPLHIAAKKGYIQIAEKLLNHGACINSLTLTEGCKALNFTSEQSNEETVKFFLNKEGLTPLHSAVKNKQEEIAELLISYGADINAQDNTGKSPIFYAIQNADLNFTKLLLSNKASVKNNPELLNMAVKKECIEMVEALLQHDADINSSDKYGRIALHFTTLNEDEGLNNEDPDININSELALRKLSDDKRFLTDESLNKKGEIAKLLLSKGANVNSQTKNGITTLCAAIQKGYTKVVEALLEYNANLNSGVESDIIPLHLSIKRGNNEIFTMLLNKGADVHSKEKNGLTPLHIAVELGRHDFVKILLEHGAKIDSKIENKITPLHLCAKKGHWHIIETLLKFGADINSRDDYGRTALHIASEYGHTGVVNILLKYGSDINSVTRDNRTPLECIKPRERLFYKQRIYYDSHVFIVQTNLALKRHIVKMKTANLYLNESNLLSISSSDEISDFQDECEEEIAYMKSEKINNANITFYDILARGTSLLLKFMKNEIVLQVLKSDDYKSKFPIYASMIKNNFEKAIKRQELLEHVNEIFYFLFDNIPKLPDECTEKILSYLRDEDLKIIVDASKL